MVSLMQYRAAVGLYNAHLKARECLHRVKGKFWSMLLFLFYLESIYLPTLRNVVYAWQMSYYTKLWFTQICMYRCYIPLLIRLANDVEMNPGPCYFVDTSKIVTADFHQGNVSLFGSNSGKQCVAMCLTAVVYNFRTNASTWIRNNLNEILLLGNSLYSHLCKFAGKDYLLLSEIPSALSINNETFFIRFSESSTGDLHMSHIRDCHLPLQHAFVMLMTQYNAFLLTIEINTVAVIVDNHGHYKLFDSHSRDSHGNVATNGTSVLLEFNSIGEVVQYLQNFYCDKEVVPFEILGVNVTYFPDDQSSMHNLSCNPIFTEKEHAPDSTKSCDNNIMYKICDPLSDGNENPKAILDSEMGLVAVQALPKKTQFRQNDNIQQPETSGMENVNISWKRKQTNSLATEKSCFQKSKKGNIAQTQWEERECILQKDRKLYQKRKETESSEQREKRLKTAREHKRKVKTTETKQQIENRLKRSREQKRQVRESENKEQIENRLKGSRERKRQVKESENKEQRENRLKRSREQKRQIRESENKEQIENRLKRSRERKRQVTESENKEQRENRLKRSREQKRQVRETETEEQREIRLKNRKESYKKRKDKANQTCIDNLVGTFHKLVATGPTFVCICCDQLWYKHSLVRGETVRKLLDNEVVSKCLPRKEQYCTMEWVCRTCYHHIKQSKMPPCAVQNKMSFPNKPDFLDLSELEWRLVSPRLIFQKIHEAARGKQCKIHGNVVNVPADVVNTVNILPRVSAETDTIKVQLKRKLKYKSHVMSQNIRPSKVFEAARWLTESGSLYREESIKLNTDWTYLFTDCQTNDNRVPDNKPCCSSSSTSETCTMVKSINALNATEQIVLENTEFSFYFDKVFVCLDCEKVLTDHLSLESHMLHDHKVEIDEESCQISNLPIFHQSDCSSNEVVYFCSVCSAWEKDKLAFTEHMTVVHDLPALEDDISLHIDQTATVSIASTINVFRHKILEPENVLLLEGGHCGSTSPVSLKAFVGIPGVLNLSRGPDSNEELLLSQSPKDSCTSDIMTEDHWNEVDESELCAGTLDTLLTPPDFVEDCEREKVLNFAPGESNHPISIFKDQYCEELAYPGIFCGQARADNKDRYVPVYYSDICKSELRRSDRRAAHCVENIFFKLKKLQMKIILGKCQVALRKHKTKGKTLTAGDLKKDGALDRLVHLDEGYRFLRALRGSPPYFEKAKKDLFAMIRQLGSATFFCSFSAAETKWNHLLTILGKLIDNKTYTNDQLNAMTWEDKSRLIQSDPVTCARHFDFQVQQFIFKFLQSDCAPLGKIEDWFYRVEFQQRGSPHIHMILWIEGAPKFGEDSDEDVCNFIDNIISCSRPVNNCDLAELVSRQIHSHSFTCKKKFQKQCRFNFPQPPMKRTQILYPLTDVDKISNVNQYKTKWKQIHEQLNAMKEGENISFEELLDRLEVTEDQYIIALRSSLNRTTIFLKRNPNELRVNNYNKHCLLAWRANMDVQFILDIYSCAMYVVSYISKAQRGMSELLRKACEEAREGNLSIKQQVRDIGNKFLNSVEISAQEAVYIVLQLPMRRSSREVVFINTSLPDERVCLLKSIDDIKQLEDNSEDIESGGLIKRYTKRPSYLENVTLADWAAWYDNSTSNFKCFKKCKTTDTDGLPLEILDEDNSEDDEINANVIPSCSDLTTNKKQKQIKKRSKPRVIRSVWFNKESYPEKHYRELLMLFTAWRNENTDLLEDCSTYMERCQILREQINDQMSHYAASSEQLDQAFDDMQTIEYSDDMWNSVAPNAQHTECNLLAEAQNESIGGMEITENYDLSVDLGIPSSSATCNSVQNVSFDEMPDEDYRQTVRSLNTEQMRFFYHILHLVKTCNEPFYCFLSGGAGVGKSHLTKALFQAVYKYLNTRAGDDFHQIKAILLAPTGKAAYNIRGNTIHTSLGLPVNQSLKIYKKLDPSRLNSFRSKFAGLKIIFIDEMSMVGNSMLNIQINKRLQDIKGTTSDFGGVSIVAIGDLFQLQPVFDGYCFEDLHTDYAALATNLWQKHFTMFELNEIMRQRESRQFAEILNRLREGSHTNSDLNVLMTRIIQDCDPNYPKHAPHLFIQNNRVDDFNLTIYNSAATRKYVVKAVDSVIGAQSEKLRQRLLKQVPDDPRKTMQLISRLQIAENERTELSQNIRIDDGLTNGAGNVVRYVRLLSSERPEGIVWVEFDDPEVGQKIRNENRHLYSQDTCIQLSWTPIKPVCVTFYVGKSRAAQIVRKQFPLRPSAGKTIHRSQGSTETEVVVDLSGKRAIPHVHYVALSRVTTIEGLHIKHLNEKKICVSDKVKEEMYRLRTEAYLQPSLLCLTDIGDDYTKFVFLNTRSLHKYIYDIRSNVDLNVADVNIFAETRFWLFDRNEEYKIDGFSLFRNDAFIDVHSHTQRPCGGTAVYTRALCFDEYPKCRNLYGVEITIVKLKTLPGFIIAGIYRSPKVPVRQLHQALAELHSIMLSEPFHVILGDFNIDWNDSVQRSSLFNQMVTSYGYTQHILDYTTDNRTIIDHIYSNLNESMFKTGVLETYFSDHKAVWIASKND